MNNDVILLPSAAANAVCHEEQLRIWAEEIVGRLSIEGYLRDDISYDEAISLEGAVQSELKSIVAMAFDHPEVRSIKLKRDA